MYYSDGGPGPATKLLRLDADPQGEYQDWLGAAAFRWEPTMGWFPIEHAQLDIMHLGELFLIDPDDMPMVQQQMRDSWDRAARRV
jgi:hypothetical protein